MRIILASASPRRRELLGQIGLDFEVRVSHVEEKVSAVEPGLVVEELSRQKAEAVLGEFACGEDVLVIGADTVVSVDGRILGKPSDEENAREMLETLSGRSHEVYTGVTLLYRAGTGETDAVACSDALGADAKACGDVLGDEAAVRLDALGAEVAGSDAEAVKAGVCSDALGDEAAAGSDAAEAKAGVCSDVPGAEGSDAGGRCRVRRRTFHEKTRVDFYSMTAQEISRYVSSGDCMDKAGAYGIQGLCARYIRGIEGDYNNVVGLPAGRLYQELFEEIKEWMEQENGKKSSDF